ncbi:MAG: hypothetical protein ACK4V2_06750 [Pseudomonadota bacterium]|jgi:hypothetical protein
MHTRTIDYVSLWCDEGMDPVVKSWDVTFIDLLRRPFEKWGPVKD